MKAIFAVTALVASIGLLSDAGAQDSAIGADATCTVAGLPAPVTKVVNGLNVYVRPLAVIKDPAMDDFGSSAPGDSLFIYCVLPRADAQLGRAAFCLTKEACPWR